jgi:hypothetical protein
MTDKELYSKALAIVEDASGGIKFTELVCQFVSLHGRDPDFESYDFVTRLEIIIRSSSELKILDYTFHALNRQKMFVYTP